MDLYGMYAWWAEYWRLQVAEMQKTALFGPAWRYPTYQWRRLK